MSRTEWDKSVAGCAEREDAQELAPCFHALEKGDSGGSKKSAAKREAGTWFGHLVMLQSETSCRVKSSEGR